MSHILCVWADMDEPARQWHEKKKISEVANQLGARALHFQVQDNPFEEPHKITSEWFTLYDGLDAKTVKALSEQLGSQEHPFSGAPKRAHFNVHHCEELACWTTRNYGETYVDMGCLVAGALEPPAEKHDEFFEWYRTDFIPPLIKGGAMLRARLFKTMVGTSIQGETHRRLPEKQVLKYTVVYEFTGDDIPFEILVYMAQSENWRRYVEEDLPYHFGLYHLRSAHPDNGLMKRRKDRGAEDGTEEEDDEDEKEDKA